MKRVLGVVVVLMVAVAAFGAEQTHRYVVAMKPERATAREAKGVEFSGRDFQDLRFLDAFIANLTDAEVAQLRKDPSVRYVESAEIKYHAIDDDGTTANKVTPLSHPIDAQVTPYGITMVHAPDVWPVTRGDGINVAIVDTGVDYTHPELSGIYQGGFNAITSTNDPKDDEGHGTHVSGTVAAADNKIGVVGVAPNVKLWAVKVLDSTGSGSNGKIAAGLNWVLGKKQELGGNWIINMSLGGPDSSAVLSDACSRLAAGGILIFAAAGNTDLSTATAPDPVAYPAAYPSVTAVAAIDSSSAIADFSNQGPQVALSGPGVDVFSTFPVGQGSNAFVTSAGQSYDAFGLVGAIHGNPTGHYVYCGLGASASDFPASVRGNIALIQRGSATFNAKTKNALAAGATSVVIYNCSIAATPSTCSNESFGNWTLIGKDTAGNDLPADLAFAWPVAVGISNADGETLRKAAANSTLTEVNVADDYATESGTSMACPHAVGVAALVWSAAPNASASDVKNAMINTAHDLGPTGQDPAFGYGLLDALAAAKSIAPQKFGTGVTPIPVPGRRILKRGH
jgi:subtilisin family serine protease